MEELEKEILKILEIGNDDLLNDFKLVEDSFLTTILKHLRDGFSYTSKKLDNSNSNKRLIIGLRNFLVKYHNFELNDLAIRKYLNNVESILDLNKKEINERDFNKLDFSLEKQILFEDTITRITDKSIFIDTEINDVRQDIFRAITFNQTYKQLESNLSKTLENTKAASYVKQISSDSINQFDGAIQQKKQELYNFNAFSFNGSLIATSRKTCMGMVNGTGVYEKFLIPNYRRKAYYTKDIPKLIALNKGSGGWNPDTNSENYATLRNGFQCRHRLAFFRYVP